ncbi:PP2C family serine/threonine-protein phosphatase [Marinobacter sp.]|uniref:PP2C family serine/threonine-protein phosphatase n=1 Tax=Marinobacter sp. TaxID=50741 RepID=UPI001B789552|nr:PP2C family serine/threonine-protein phosphatase [Marinobacter sp.]MBQ0832408.1 protein phosphatase 2C domain-containing protein [Marinobacter sp.]
MKRSKEYYKQVLDSLLFESRGQRLPDKQFNRVMEETDGPTLIDEFRERFEETMREQLQQAGVSERKTEMDPAILASDATVRDSEGQAVPEQNNVNANDVDNKALDTLDAHTLQPGEIPASASVESSLPAMMSRTENLPNGRSGQPYDVSLDELLHDLPPQLQLESDAESGLSLTDGRRLQGTPTVNGSFQLTVVGLDDQNRPTLQLQLKLALIPSSRELWKDQPSDPDAPYAKPNDDVDRLLVGNGWHMAMGSQRGRSHAHRGGQRDDHGVIAQTASGWNVLIVGDGAGSCEFSRHGSLLATTVARDALLSSLKGDEGVSLEAAALTWWKGGDYSRMPQELLLRLKNTVITAVHAAHCSISEESRASGHSMKSFSTTLLLALHKETPEGHLVVTFGIGDGGIAALTGGRQAQMLNTADSGEHAGQTRFLDAPLFQEQQGLYQRVTVKVYEALDALVLATDGITDPKFSSDNDMHNAESWWSLYDELAPALAAPDEQTEQDPLLDYLNFFVERHHDDRTLAVLYRDTSEPIQCNSEAST